MESKPKTTKTEAEWQEYLKITEQNAMREMMLYEQDEDMTSQMLDRLLAEKAAQETQGF